MRLHTIPTDAAYLEPIRITGGTIFQRVLRGPEDAPASFLHLPLEHGALPQITRYLQFRDEAGSSPLNPYFLRVHDFDPFPILNPAGNRPPDALPLSINRWTNSTPLSNIPIGGTVYQLAHSSASPSQDVSPPEKTRAASSPRAVV